MYPLFVKKSTQNFPAFARQNAAFHLNLAVEFSLGKHGIDGNHRAAFRVRRTVDDARYPGMKYGAGTHDAGLDGHVERGPHETIVIRT